MVAAIRPRGKPRRGLGAPEGEPRPGRAAGGDGGPGGARGDRRPRAPRREARRREVHVHPPRRRAGLQDRQLLSPARGPRAGSATSRSGCGSRSTRRAGCRSTRRRGSSPTAASARWRRRRALDSRERLINVADYVERAAETVDPKIWCYFEGGAGDEVTLRANVGAYGRWRLRPRMLVDVAEVSPRRRSSGRRSRCRSASRRSRCSACSCRRARSRPRAPRPRAGSADDACRRSRRARTTRSRRRRRRRRAGCSSTCCSDRQRTLDHIAEAREAGYSALVAHGRPAVCSAGASATCGSASRIPPTCRSRTEGKDPYAHDVRQQFQMTPSLTWRDLEWIRVGVRAAARRSRGSSRARTRRSPSSTAPTRSASRTTAAGSSTASRPGSTRCPRWSRRSPAAARSTSTAASAAGRTSLKALALGARAAFGATRVRVRARGRGRRGRRARTCSTLLRDEIELGSRCSAARRRTRSRGATSSRPSPMIRWLERALDVRTELLLAASSRTSCGRDASRRRSGSATSRGSTRRA